MPKAGRSFCQDNDLKLWQRKIVFKLHKMLSMFISSHSGACYEPLFDKYTLLCELQETMQSKTGVRKSERKKIGPKVS